MKNCLNEQQRILSLPNIISFLRIICSVVLIVIKPLSILFFCLYVICGISDMLDGMVARKLKLETDFGALLDSIADTILIIVLCYVMISILDWENWIIDWIVVIAIIRILSLLVGGYKFHTFATIHTYGNKVAGFSLFLFPIIVNLCGMKVTSIVLCIIATSSNQKGEYQNGK